MLMHETHIYIYLKKKIKQKKFHPSKQRWNAWNMWERGKKHEIEIKLIVVL